MCLILHDACIGGGGGGSDEVPMVVDSGIWRVAEGPPPPQHPPQRTNTEPSSINSSKPDVDFRTTA
jgi:hypothetical protein